MPAEDFDKLISEDMKLYRGARHPTDLYVSPAGSDKWSGALADPDPAANDGPLATIARARDLLRRARTPGPVTVWLRGGRYALRQPLVFGPDDSGPITYAAFPNEEVILDGGRRIDGWRDAQINGRRAWAADLPDVRAGQWHFTQLFVNGRRRPRPKLPKSGYFIMEHVPGVTFEAFMSGRPSDHFYARQGDFQTWANLTDIDVVAFHYWNEERMPVTSFDPATRRVRCARQSVWPLKDDVAPRFARYWVENVREALLDEGEWYLDRSEGVLYYLPLAGETPQNTQIFAPSIEQLILIHGDPSLTPSSSPSPCTQGEGGGEGRGEGLGERRPILGLTFRGIHFLNTAWHQPGERAGFEQAAMNVPAVISLRHARHCAIENCTIQNVGFYGIELDAGCQGIRIAGNTICDTGAGGVKIVGVPDHHPLADRTCGNVVSDNEIAEGGKVFHSAVGVLIIHSAGNDIVHNHIHHLEYSGISCGWVWGYGANPTRDNLIAHNHIHHIGSGLLNDMGGIYTLGVQPGTILRSNLIHDVRMHNYGGWCIYLDEGTSHVVVENNVCYNADSEIFQLHYGRENIVRNNIFAFSKLGIVSLTVSEKEHKAFTFERNIVLSDGTAIFTARDGSSLDRRGFSSDLNLLWDVSSGEKVFSANQHRDAEGNTVLARRWDLPAMRAMGHDRHSLAADPRLGDPRRGNFALSPDSPALSLGFVPVDLSKVGPRRR
jgi:hypothetical protein